MKVYHGSYTSIEEINLAQCRSHRDFGRGFYVTKFLHHAEKWSITVSRRHKTQGVVSEFEYQENSFTHQICKIKKFDAYNEEWLDFVIINRNENIPEPAHDYDIVEGPVADDKVQNRIDLYLEGGISKAGFLEELKYHEETHQICFCTLNSLQTLNHVNKTPRRNITDISEPLLETLMLEKNIDERTASRIFYTSAVFVQLSDKNTELYKKPWQEIYEMLKKELKVKN
jgi:hypothetical protein